MLVGPPSGVGTTTVSVSLLSIYCINVCWTLCYAPSMSSIFPYFLLLYERHISDRHRCRHITVPRVSPRWGRHYCMFPFYLIFSAFSIVLYFVLYLINHFRGFGPLLSYKIKNKQADDLGWTSRGFSVCDTTTTTAAMPILVLMFAESSATLRV